MFFDRKLTWKRHVTERAAKAHAVARHIKDIARTARGPPAADLRNATITNVIPSVLYGTEAWYEGSKKANGVSTQQGWHPKVIERTLALAVRGVLPVYRTTPTAALFRDAGLRRPKLLWRRRTYPANMLLRDEQKPRTSCAVSPNETHLQTMASTPSTATIL